MSRKPIVAALCIILVAVLASRSQAVALGGREPSPPLCKDSTGASAGDHGFNSHANRKCGVGSEASGGNDRGAPAPTTKVIECGPPQVSGQLRPAPGDRCGQVHNICDVASVTNLPTDPSITTQVTLERQPDGTWRQVGLDCSVKTAEPQVTPLLVREQARKLVPHPGIGIAPPGGATLVNIQTLLWLNTPANQRLATVSLLGHHVTIRVHIERIDWTFGDGHTDTTSSPQRKYDPADSCHTTTCPSYWGHTYTNTGTMTIAATITWSGRYQIDGGAPQDIAGAVTSPATNTTVTVRQARGILVPDPGVH
jgi:hypothetical protein